ncbi:MAG: KR domain-containing protein [Tolypothrix brevis GSE-NOS-MK-07-07A]|jgi:acyl transferase domain-containing protein/acyl carrier protein|nr:KR domain-containing protein [Tolypothrix brevis GSE-NOS-MK-07-07A]
MVSTTSNDALEGIAIIGMSGRFPGAKDISSFWQNLCDGVEAISTFTDEELIEFEVSRELLNNSNYLKVGAILEDIDLFDASFFGFNPKEAEITDPQHRLFLECAWEALENAGYDSQNCKSRIGVYAGASLNNYQSFNLNRDQIGSANSFQKMIGNDKDFLATRVSYKLNLTGPSLTVQTACSTSLVATSLACQSLLNYQCDMALAGGVSIRIPQKTGYLHQEGGILSPDGHCRAFDAKARGTIIGNGAGVVVLKRLADAIADGDHIYAVIKGNAINNDGSGKVGYTAPSVNGQAQVIAEALALADVEAETISYIEAHGTGTVLGDPIEISALTNVFRESTDQKGFCAIGSVKTNIGHLDAAAGVTSLIKTALALKHQQIPPSLNFEQPNPEIDFANSPFYVNTKLTEWKTTHIPRRAGVSSLGIGGTNAHVILEEAPILPESTSSRPWQLLVLSAKTDSALKTASVNLVNHLKQYPDLNLADIAYTLQCGRQAFEHRQTVVCRDIADAIVAFENPKRVLSNTQETQELSVAFMFPGLGTQYENMGWELYQVESIFRKQVDYCCEFLKPLLGQDLRDILYPNRNSPQTQENQQSISESSGLDLRKMLGRNGEQPNAQLLSATSLLNQTDLAQPAIFVIEYALAQLLMSWGIHPQAMIGYSIGEYVAATVAGVLSLEEGLKLIAARAQMIQKLPGGAMLAVPLSQAEISPLLNHKLSLSAVNGQSMCVVAGETKAVETLEQQLIERGLACRRLETSHAFHSHMMEGTTSDLRELVKTFNLQAPKIPYVSNVTGTWITAAEATNPDYWVKHLCQAVLFAPGIQELWKQQHPILLEVGPGQTLGSFALQCIENNPTVNQIVLPSLRYSYDRQSDLAFLLKTLGRLWLAGLEIDWSGFYAREHRHRVPLPTYPFERQRYWSKNDNKIHPGDESKIGKNSNIADWFYVPSWKQLPLVKNEQVISACYIVFVDECGVGSKIVQQLRQAEQDVIAVLIGDNFEQINSNTYTINPEKQDDYNTLLQAIQKQEKTPNLIIHLWSVANSLNHSIETIQNNSFWSLIYLVQSLEEQNFSKSVRILVVTNNLYDITGEEKLSPIKATVLGACKVIPQEYLGISCCQVDIVIPESNIEKLIESLIAEQRVDSGESIIAYRGNHRWVQVFEPINIEKPIHGKTRLRQEGVYLITGGMGGVGLELAKYLAHKAKAKLILIGRSEVPKKEYWDDWLTTHDVSDAISCKIQKVQELEKLGAEVLVLSADVTNDEQMQTVIDLGLERFGAINGVIHAAGFTDFDIELIQYKSSGKEKNISDPKVKGTLVLHNILKNINLDFWVLISSLSSVLGGLGDVDYCAANNFLDKFAHFNTRQNHQFTVAINWDAWKEVGMAVKSDVSDELKKLRKETIENGMLSTEAIDAFDRILGISLSQVIVSTRYLQALINKNSKSILSNVPDYSLDNYTNLSDTKYSRNLQNNTYIAPRNKVEQSIADIWKELLGFEKIGVNDNFLDLGGNSLMATQMISQLRKFFQVELSLRTVFEAQTIADLALAIEDTIIKELEELTEDDN